MITDCCGALTQRALEPEAAEILRPHAGKTLGIRMGPAGFCLRIGVDGIPRRVHPSVKADAAIHVPLARLAGWGAEPISTAGDSDLLAACSRLKEEADLGPDALIERALGPAAGSVAANAMEAMRSYAGDAGPRLRRTTLSWLTGAGGILPAPREASAHAEGVARFAARVDRLRDSMIDAAAAEGA